MLLSLHVVAVPSRYLLLRSTHFIAVQYFMMSGYCIAGVMTSVMSCAIFFLYLLVNPRIWRKLYAVRSEQGMATLPQYKEHYHEEIRRSIQGPLPRDLRGVSSYFSVA